MRSSALWHFAAGLLSRLGPTQKPENYLRDNNEQSRDSLLPPASCSLPTALGWLPALCLVGAVGLLLVAVADTGTRNSTAGAEILFWLGLVALFTPIAGRLASARASRCERIGLVALLGLGIYLVKVLHSPLSFTLYDELLHVRTANDILGTAHLFAQNPLLPVSTYFPGLESVTTALMELTGLNLFAAGVLVIGLARLLLVLALFLFYEELSRSAHVAGLATLLYMANPNFTFFVSQFAYESLALALAVFVLYATVRWLRLYIRGMNDMGGMGLVAVIAICSVVITHHVTSYALAGFLVYWTVVDYLGNRRGEGRARIGKVALPGPGWAALVAVVATLLWLVFVGDLTVSYLGGFFGQGLQEIVRLILGEENGRQLFRGSAGDTAPLWEQLTGYASVLLILGGLPLGLWQIWRQQRDNALALALAVAALAYPATQALRLTYFGLQVAGRTVEFLFVAIAFVLAAGMAPRIQTNRWLTQRPSPRMAASLHGLIAGWATVIFLGGLILGWPRWARLPGPYLVIADTRSIEQEGLAAAQWAQVYLGPGNRIAGDRINDVLMGSYGGQHPVTSDYEGVDVPRVFFPSELGPAEQKILRQGGVRYLVVDRRLSNSLPLGGVYFEYGEPDANRHTIPINPAALNKFGQFETVSRVFDSGELAIYDLGALSSEP